MPWKPAGTALGFKDNRSVYVNTATGETMGRREYDRTHGRFKGRGISSNEAYSKLLKSAGLPKNTKGVAKVTVRTSEQSGMTRRHIVFTGQSQKQVDATIAKMRRHKGFHNTNISVVYKTSKGEYRRSRVFYPEDSNLSRSLATAAAELASLYGEDDDEGVDYGDVEYVWGESL